MRIANKLSLLVVGLLGAQLATVGVAGALFLQQDEENRETTRTNEEQVQAAHSMYSEYLHQTIAFERMARASGSSSTSAITERQKFETSARAVSLNIKILEFSPNDDLSYSVNEFSKAHAELTKRQREQVQGFLEGRTDEQALANTENLRAVADDASEKPLNVINRQAARDNITSGDRTARQATLGLVAAAIFAGFVGFIALVVTRSIVSPLRNLTDRAHQLANHDLPAAVDVIQTQQRHFTTPQLETINVDSGSDELIELADALDSLKTRSVELAAEQRRTELAHGATLVNLGRRNQSLLSRTLAYLSDLEREERDPDALSRLFRLDHLTTRVRRNAESMLVLAGAEQSRKHSRPVTIENVVRAALSEIEEYARVNRPSLEGVSIVGSAATDLAHLLAEILENATHFSPQDAHVDVFGRHWNSDYVISIVDRGLGLNPDDLADANALIATASSRRTPAELLGFHIVGRIADRRGMQVILTSTEGGGVTAQVLIPRASLYLDPSNTTSGEVAAFDPNERDVLTPVHMVGSPNLDSHNTPTPDDVASPQTNATPAAPADATSSSARLVESGGGRHVAPTVEPPTLPAPQLADSSIPQLAPESTVPNQRDLPQGKDVTPENLQKRRRVKGANMPDLGGDPSEFTSPRDANEVGRQLTTLQESVNRARKEGIPRPMNRNVT